MAPPDLAQPPSSAPGEPAPRAPLEPARRAPLELARTFIYQLLRALKQVALYRHSEARFAGFAQKTHEALRDFTSKHGALKIKVDLDAFTLYGESLLTEQTPLPYKFFKEGVRTLVFQPTLTPNELVTLLTIFVSDPERGAGELHAQIWEAQLLGFELVLVEGFRLGELAEGEIEVEVDTIVEHLENRLRTSSTDSTRHARIDVQDIEATLDDVEQLRGVVVLAPRSATDALKAQLQRELEHEQLHALMPKVLAAIFGALEGGAADLQPLEDTFLHLLDMLLLTGDLATANGMVVKLRALSGANAALGGVLETLRQKMGDPQRLHRLGESLRATRAPRPEDVLQYLGEVPPAAATALLDVLEGIEVAANRALLLKVLLKWLPQAPEPFVERLKSDRPATVRDVATLLEKARHPERLKHFALVMRSLNPAIKRELLGVLSIDPTPQSRALVVTALDDESPLVRAQAARALPEFGGDRAFTDLVKHLRAPAFAERAAAERQAFYAALAATDAPAAFTYLETVLHARGSLFNKQRATEEKLVAVQGLAAAGTMNALRVLNSLANETGQGPDVLGAARAAAFRIKKAMLGEGGPEGDAMAEAMRIGRGEMSEELDGVGREHSEKLQGLARALVSGLYMLTRSARMYEPSNRIFERPLIQLQDIITQIVAREGKLELLGIRSAFYLNGMLVKIDAASLDNVRQLLDELRAKDVTGFTLVRPVQIEELQNFIWIFSKEQATPVDDDGLPGRKLMAMTLARWSKLKDKVERGGSEGDGAAKRLDRKKYMFVVYARAVFFVRKYMTSLESAPMNTSDALRIVQDLVDLAGESRTHFLGLTSTRSDEADYLSYHQVNACLMTIVLGHELGLTKQQLRDLGYAAMFHEAGMQEVPLGLRQKHGTFTPAERAVVQRTPLLTVRSILREKVLTRTTLVRIAATSEYKLDFGRVERDPQGRARLVPGPHDVGLYARIISICATFDALTSRRPFREAYGPEIALTLMGGELRHRFDPALLEVFMQVMRLSSVKVLPVARSISLG